MDDREDKINRDMYYHKVRGHELEIARLYLEGEKFGVKRTEAPKSDLELALEQELSQAKDEIANLRAEAKMSGLEKAVDSLEKVVMNNAFGSGSVYTHLRHICIAFREFRKEVGLPVKGDTPKPPIRRLLDRLAEGGV